MAKANNVKNKKARWTAFKATIAFFMNLPSQVTCRYFTQIVAGNRVALLP